MKKKRKAEAAAAGACNDEVSALKPAYRAILPNTSPLRRSPRRHQSSSLNRSSFLSAQPLTSPTGLSNPSRGPKSSLIIAENVGPSGKRRKFTTALSAAALRVETKTAEGRTPDEGSFLQSIPQFKPQINGKDAVFNLSDNNATLQQAKEVFGDSNKSNAPPAAVGAGPSSNANLNTPAIDGMISHEDASFDFFLNASPGTIMRSFNIMSPKKNGTPTNDPPSAATIKASFPNLGLSPLQSRILASDATGTSAVFSPLGSSLSTPFRALLNPASATKGRERATSEQPPASHSRLMQELDLRDAPDGQNQQQILSVPHPNGAPQFLSSDDNLLGSASNVQINLLPATADRRQGGKTAETGNAANNLLLSDSMMNDFNAFLLNSSNGLFSPTPFIPKPDTAGKPALAPLTLPHDAIKQQSLSPLAMLSSEMDVDLSNLPPSSPPPLPGSSMVHHASSNSLANVQAFWNTFNSGFSNNGNYLASNKNGMQTGQQIDDGQSPISVSTTVTQGGTPQDMPISHDTGPSEPGHSVIEEKGSTRSASAASRNRVAKAGTSSNVESPLSLIDTDSMHDPLFEYFSFANDTNGSTAHDYVSHHHRQSSASSVSSAFLERLKKSTSGQGSSTSASAARSSSSSMAMTWSDSTASVSSLASMPVTDLTARSKLLQKQKALEEAKRTNVPIDSAVLENTLDAFLDMD
ncbi:hypothetical protein P389DRAFT_167312, partial [Cystobasidium minutum MCA 4210]|uniref:uncharacterized protein n=1 Tax=Cystobasidium minutum MCA 4210 TaxID=1397322 RepID=UPI0034CD95E7|eukprot:jgi/Rhomi1/167312/fgenesh1_kg.2_\